MRSLKRVLQNDTSEPTPVCITWGATDVESESNIEYCRSGVILTYTIPSTGWYFIVANGASGSRGNGYGGYTSYIGGNGAKVWGYFYLTSGTLLRIIPGRCGRCSDGTAADGSGGGGGGASWVFRVNSSGDSRWSITKSTKYNSANSYSIGERWETLICAAGGSSTGDCGYSSSYRANGYNASSTLWTPDNFKTFSTSSTTATSSSTLSLNQILNYDGYGGTYTRNSSTSYGGFGCGATQDDNRGSGGGWCYTTQYKPDSFCSGEHCGISVLASPQGGNVSIIGCF